jgi:hypothetical protein
MNKPASTPKSPEEGHKKAEEALKKAQRLLKIHNGPSVKEFGQQSAQASAPCS